MSVWWLSSFSFTSSTVVVSARGGRHNNSSSYMWTRRRSATQLFSSLSSLSCMHNNMMKEESQSDRYHRREAFRPLVVHRFSSSSDSNSNPSRGFGLPSPPTESNTDTNSKSNTTKKKTKKKNKLDNSSSSSTSDALLAPGLSTSGGRRGIDSTNKLRTTPSDIDFEQKLQAIKRSALEQKKVVQNTQYAAIDYDQPPEAPNTNSTDTPKTVGLGTKIGVGVAVVIFGFVFALGDFLPTSSDAPSQESTVVDSKLSEEERKSLQTRLQQFETALTANPKDPMTVEGAAVTLAELGEYSRASSLLEDLTKIKPNDPDAFRLLGEVKYQLKDYQGSAAAYKRSSMVSKTVNFEVVRGLTNALLAAKRPNEAVQFLLASRDQLNAKTMAGESSLGADDEVIDPVQVELLLGKAYSDWGHVSDAVSVYDQLISAHPEDFRGYLAKGIIMRENGRAGDAERMFIQARFFAPEKAKALVDRYARK